MRSGRILLVEDDADTRELMQRWLTRDGHEVAAAATGERALALLATQGFDLAVVDIELPGIDGLELVRRMGRERLSQAAILVASVTDRDDAETLDGEVYWLTKPFERAQLCAAVAVALRDVDA